MQKAFTLVELLVVIAIIALIVAMAIPLSRKSSPSATTKSDQQIVEETHTSKFAERSARYIKDIRFTYESQGVSPDNTPVILVTDKTTGKQYLIVGEGGVEIK